MTFTITIPLWLPISYLIIGLVLWLPMEYYYWRTQLHNPPPFWSALWRGCKREPWDVLLCLVVWPLAVYRLVCD